MAHSIDTLPSTARINRLKETMLAEPRFVSIEQARIITRVYREHPDDPKQLLRAKSLAAALDEIAIRIEPGERIVGNRTAGVRGGVVFPEAGISWIAGELDTLPSRPQDRFQVRAEDAEIFRVEIEPFWRGRSLEDGIRASCGTLVDEIAMVAKINQKDHAQGHICPDTEGWLREGPAGLCGKARARLEQETDAEKQVFYLSLVLVLEAASRLMLRYAALAHTLAGTHPTHAKDLSGVARICEKLATQPPGDLP